MKHSHRYFAKLTLTALLVVAALVSFTSVSSGAPIKIGFFAPESGFAAADGQSAYDSAKLAVADINKAGGINGDPLAYGKTPSHESYGDITPWTYSRFRP